MTRPPLHPLRRTSSHAFFAIALLIACFSSLPTELNAQLVHVQGEVAHPTAVDFIGNMTIYAAADSAIIKASYIDSTHFSQQMDLEGHTRCFARFELFGFRDTSVQFEVTDSVISLGVIHLTTKMLAGVEVVAQKPLFLRTMQGIEVTVAGTELQTLTNLFEVLKASPKLHSPDDERIEIIGMGSPLILIDRQAIISVEELKAIPADQIERIEIMTSPPAKYQAQGRGGGVIEVYTKNFRLQGYNMSVNTSAGLNVQAKPTGSLSLSASFKKRKFSLSAYVGGSGRTRLTTSSGSGSSTDSTQRGHTSSSESLSSVYWYYASLKAAYEISEKQRLSAGLRGHASQTVSESEQSQSYFEQGVVTLDEMRSAAPNSVWGSNRGFLNYSWETDSHRSNLEIDLSYTLKGSSSRNELGSEFDAGPGMKSSFLHQIRANDQPRVAEFRAGYEHVFDTSGWKLNVGGAFNILNNGKRFERSVFSDGAWLIDPTYTNSYDYQELIGGLFSEVTKKWDQWGFVAGIRAEYVGLEGYSHSLQRQFVDSSYAVAFPSATVMYEPSSDLAFKVKYYSGIDRPAFTDFDPFMRIEDSLNVRIGNPYLVPEMIQSVGFEVDWKYQYGLSFGRTYGRNPVSSISFIDDSTFLTTSRPWNAESNASWYANAHASIRSKRFRGWNNIWARYAVYQFGPEFGRAPFSTFSYGAYSYVTWMMGKDWSLMNRLRITRWAGATSVNEVIVNWGIRLSKKYWDGDLSLSLDVDNILPVRARYISYSGNYTSQYQSQSEFTSIKLGVYYKFGRLQQAPTIKESESSQSDRI